jgi:hypothetical protein
MEAKGLSGREIDEMLAVLGRTGVPDFELDLSKAKPASYFEQKAAEAVPSFAPKPSDG